MSYKDRQRPTRTWPNRLPDMDLMKDIFRLHYEGYGPSDIAREVGVSRASVQGYLHLEDWYYPWVDEVAVERALAGDKAVFDRMTGYERFALLTRMSEVRLAELREAAWQDGGASHGLNRLTYWAETLGLSYTSLLSVVSHHRANLKAAAAA